MKRDFIKCGMIGWCLEVFWTGMHNAMKKDRKMQASTSLLMFPIYGMAVCLKPICNFIRGKNFLVRGGIYTFFIYLAEFISGTFLKKRGICPWDYSHAKHHVKGVIRWDYAPAWFVTGLIFEKVLKK